MNTRTKFLNFGINGFKKFEKPVLNFAKWYMSSISYR